MITLPLGSAPTDNINIVSTRSVSLNRSTSKRGRHPMHDKQREVLLTLLGNEPHYGKNSNPRRD